MIRRCCGWVSWHWNEATIGSRGVWESLGPQLRVPPAAARLLNVPPGGSWWSALRGLEPDQLEAVWPQLIAALQQPVRDLTWLAYPDTDIPLAAVRARLVLVSLLEGSLERARLELELLRRLEPDAVGDLAGRHGNYVTLVTEQVREAESWAGPSRPRGWTTLAGCPARNRVVAEGVDIARRPIWSTALPLLTDDQDQLATERVRVAERSDGLLSYHVAVSDGVAYILQSGTIRAIDLQTGEPAWPLHPSSRSPADPSYGAIYQQSPSASDPFPPRSSHAGVPRFAPTVSGSRLFARLGIAYSGGSGEPLARPGDRSFLVGLDLRTQKLLFDRLPAGDAGWEFESAPVANDSYLFASLRRRDPSSASVRVVCFSIASGRLVWQTDIVRSEVLGGILYEISNSALTLQDDRLFYNTNLGAVAALRAVTAGFAGSAGIRVQAWRNQVRSWTTGTGFATRHPA